MTHESLDERIWSHHAAGPERHRELAAELMELSESVFMGEHREEAGLLDEANRWFTQAVLRFAADDTESRRSRLLIGARWRVRKAIGFPPDEFDELAVERAAIRSVLGDEDLDDGWDDDDLDDDDLDDEDWEDEDWDDELDEDWDEDVAVARPASVARKAPCPCGSGRKYKHCCGRTTTLGEG